VIYSRYENIVHNYSSEKGNLLLLSKLIMLQFISCYRNTELIAKLFYNYISFTIFSSDMRSSLVILVSPSLIFLSLEDSSPWKSLDFLISDILSSYTQPKRHLLDSCRFTFF
jgi:hypothetical protein